MTEAGTEQRAKEQGQLIMQYARLRASHDRLLAAAKRATEELSAGGFPYAAQVLRAAIAAAEEPTPPTDNGRKVFEALREAIWKTD